MENSSGLRCSKELGAEGGGDSKFKSRQTALQSSGSEKEVGGEGETCTCVSVHVCVCACVSYFGQHSEFFCPEELGFDLEFRRSRQMTKIRVHIGFKCEPVALIKASVWRGRS